MSKNKSIVRQVHDTLNEKKRFGESKYEAQKQSTSHEGIYSYNTFKTYLAQGCAFAKWARENHNCKTLLDARAFVDPYLQMHINKGYSAWTQSTIASALAKLYGCSKNEFIPTERRHRANIVKSRKSKAIFSEEKNHEFVDFCKATGLRKHEFLNLKLENLHYDDVNGQYMLVNIKGKGGRLRDCPILSKNAVERILNTPAGQKVWSKIPMRPDIHSYRAEYCKAIYNRHARPFAEIPEYDRYYCRCDLKGVVYDKQAMRIASRALGHNRICVIAGHYLYNKEVSQ
ncbi:MAG: hypothetical protein FWE27_04480 [Defluviitaleaceae bacterium]|nr:hypothetical protein [Defluviitaleaceae bacterium]